MLDYRAVTRAVARRGQLRVPVDGLTAANDLDLTTAVPPASKVLLVTIAGLDIEKLERPVPVRGRLRSKKMRARALASDPANFLFRVRQSAKQRFALSSGGNQRRRVGQPACKNREAMA